LAAFFRADFLVGFFLAAFRATVLPAALRPARRGAAFRVIFFLLAADFRVIFFLPAPDLAAFLLRAAFFRALAIRAS